jgi:hypothetical protein
MSDLRATSSSGVLASREARPRAMAAERSAVCSCARVSQKVGVPGHVAGLRAGQGSKSAPGASLHVPLALASLHSNTTIASGRRSSP